MCCPTLLSPRRRPLIAAICALHLLDLLAPASSPSLILPGAAAQQAEGTVWATPHSQYSSSVGVLGCKVDTNRIAYWPGTVDCDKICISLSHEGRTVHLLRVDQSEGAFDVSYDAWNYLMTGASARANPTAGGAVAMEYREAQPEACASLLRTPDRKLALSASNSMNFLYNCVSSRPDSWVAKNFALYNVLDPVCSWGHDEVCTPPDWAAGENQPKCKSGLGVPAVLTNQPVYNIEYPTGKVLSAASGKVVDNPPSENAAAAKEVDSGVRRGGAAMNLALGVVSTWLVYAVAGSI
ncbi:hypothetical protein GGTG_02157 [Gaeumannomyces tritici R3-111a-1]|uniref:Cerato-platanin n=1 Tax=Gaeumannomyces tritici (strain R3-111a-1) TaxID=644352 RepID=J3NLK8_GAET3|nr:hypothetical protein GGTG_02157 [Gaeumannomyces tritici R3-111a-1]EJT82183.1 hypothetical protein GGTG_02157 [Gaeumannomyces tritici R3-111a-1]